MNKYVNRSSHETSVSVLSGFKKGFSELINLYGNSVSRNRLLICHFTWFSTSLAYYVIGNAQNFHINKNKQLQICSKIFGFQL